MITLQDVEHVAKLARLELTEEEKIKMCEIVSQSDADYIKTSTGFSTGGATLEDIELFKKHMKNGKKIKEVNRGRKQIWLSRQKN